MQKKLNRIKFGGHYWKVQFRHTCEREARLKEELRNRSADSRTRHRLFGNKSETGGPWQAVNSNRHGPRIASLDYNEGAVVTDVLSIRNFQLLRNTMRCGTSPASTLAFPVSPLLKMKKQMLLSARPRRSPQGLSQRLSEELLMYSDGEQSYNLIVAPLQRKSIRKVFM